MNASTSCARAEILAGAIALGEAGDDERRAYRAHLAQCSRCVNAVGGERDIERTAASIARARDDERWEPDLRRSITRAAQHSMRRRWAAASAMTVVAVLVIAALQLRPVIPHKSALPAPAMSAQQSAAIAAVGTENVPALQHHAESLQFRSGATMTLHVVLNAHGKPVRCKVVRGSQSSLDRAICASVLRTRP